MKHKFLILGLMVAFLAACSDLTDLNVDKKNPTTVSGETLFTSAQKNMTDQACATNVNFSPLRFYAQYWTETTYTEEANYDLATRNIPYQPWDEYYRRSLANFNEAYRLIAEEETFSDQQVIEKQNRLAVIEVCRVYCFSVLVETFGNIPYYQALDINVLNPVYDDALTIYHDLIVRLNAAIGEMNPNERSFTAAEDNINNGDTERWLKFANSLKLRMGLTLADIPSEAGLAKTTVESAAPNVILSNADNATMEYLSASPNTNPLYADQVLSNRQDYVAANTLVDAMNALDDPRRAYYFDSNVDDPMTPEVEYIGLTYGENGAYSLYTHVNESLREPTALGTLFSAAEAEFLLAEAAARGYSVGGSAEEHYVLGIRNSFEEWGASSADADAYLAKPEVAYGSAAGDWKQKIGTQAWFALYNRGYEAWTSWRRLDWPNLVAPPTALGDFPVRYTYPINEQTLSPEQYQQAAAAIGGDMVSTKLFFDKF